MNAPSSFDVNVKSFYGVGVEERRCIVEMPSVWNLGEFRIRQQAGIISLKRKCFFCIAFRHFQLDRVGVTYSTSLVHSGLTSFEKIAARNPRELELIVNKPAPFGNHIRDAAAHMPVYRIDVKQVVIPGSISRLLCGVHPTVIWQHFLTRCEVMLPSRLKEINLGLD